MLRAFKDMGSERKTTCLFKYKTPKLKGLKALSSRLPPISRNNFRDKCGNLLALLNTEIDPWVLPILSQFYDPPLRCFTFQDYQLAPTLEEVEDTMDIPMKGKSMFLSLEDLPKPKVVAVALHMTKQDVKANVWPKDNTVGFTSKFLIAKESILADEGKWDAFKPVLALLIYGIILFPNIDEFVDILDIRVFLI